jgi:hypothetical protein
MLHGECKVQSIMRKVSGGVFLIIRGNTGSNRDHLRPTYRVGDQDYGVVASIDQHDVSGSVRANDYEEQAKDSLTIVGRIWNVPKVVLK